MQKLSSLAQCLLNELITISHVHDPAYGALTLSQDRAVSATRRQAYAEVYNYLTSENQIYG